MRRVRVFPVLHPPRVGVGGDQGPTNCPQRQAACPRVGVGGWYRFYQLVESLEPSAPRAKIGVRLGVGFICFCSLFAARPSAGRGWPTNRAHGPQRRAPDGYTPGGAARELVAARSSAPARGVVPNIIGRAGKTAALPRSVDVFGARANLHGTGFTFARSRRKKNGSRTSARRATAEVLRCPQRA